MSNVAGGGRVEVEIGWVLVVEAVGEGDTARQKAAVGWLYVFVASQVCGGGGAVDCSSKDRLTVRAGHSGVFDV